MIHPIYRVVAFAIVAPYTLRVTFDDATTQVIDFSPILEGELYGPLRDVALFSRVQIDPEVHTLVWPNGADFDPATLHDWPEHLESFKSLACQWALAATSGSSPRNCIDITNKKIWQVAAGDNDRNYAGLCLEWDVILNGPGSEGPWPDCIDALRTAREVSERKLTDLRRFSEGIKDGDLIVLRMGTTDVFGMGEVVGDYVWHMEFGDIDGWDLEHVRRVRWLWKYDKVPQRFNTYTLKLGDTVQPMDSVEVKNWLYSLSLTPQSHLRPLSVLPDSSNDTDLETISEYLFDHGVASNAIQTLINEIGELIRIAKWYQRTGAPSEAETVSYLVIPLLRALGWTPQRMAVEWRSVDLALFSKLPRADEHLSVVVEAKQKDRSCLTAKSQAQYYAEQPGRSLCQRLIVTDGVRYGIYLKRDGVFASRPHAYLNLTRMRAEYPVLECAGAQEAFLMMSADWAGSATGT